MPGRCPSPKQFQEKRVAVFGQELRKLNRQFQGKLATVPSGLHENKELRQSTAGRSRSQASPAGATGLCTSFERIGPF
jgi:hypothetical protein